MNRPYAEVIGDPIAHSKSPLIHNFWLKKLGIDAEYRKTHVRAEELAAFFEHRRDDASWCGCNVTIPHKIAVLGFVRALSEDATKVGAVNTILPLESGFGGHNTDVPGVALATKGIDLQGKEVCVIGAGGAARSAFRHLESRQPIAVSTIARDVHKALAVIASFDLCPVSIPMDEAISAILCAKLLINATQLGMVGQEPMPEVIFRGIDVLDEDAVVFDMVYAPLETRLLAAARARGLRTIDGLEMLVGQAAIAFELFFGEPAPREHDAELRALLTA